MNHKKTLPEYTEEEFLELIREIDRANEHEPDHVLGKLLQYFCDITEHPSGTDLLYRPVSEEQGEPENVLLIVKKWRADNGKPGFKN